METIESTVQLPKGARSIDEYSRNYAFMPDGKVLAVFIIPMEPTGYDREGFGCEVMLEDFESRPCTDEEISDMKQQDRATTVSYGAANESRWFDDYLELPMILDGGCAQVTIVFEPRSETIETAECNGSI